MFEGSNSEGQRLIVNTQDNYVRGIDEGEILSQAGVNPDGPDVVGRVYDADGNDVAESTGTNYSTIANRGYEQIIRSTAAIRVTDSAFNFNRGVQDWNFFRILTVD